jgi:hypothetical protein
MHKRDNPLSSHSSSLLIVFLVHFRSFADLYHQKRGEESLSPSSKAGSLGNGDKGTSDRDVYLLAVFSITTFLFIFSLFLLYVVRRRRHLQTKHALHGCGGFLDGHGENGHSIRLLMQATPQHAIHQPDLIRGGNSTMAGASGVDKMQLISRLNNFDSSIVEHLVVRERELLSSNNLDKNIGGATGSCSSVNALVTPLHRASHQNHQLLQARSSPAPPLNVNAYSDGSSTEPDYAEPVITSPASTFTPERRPPLPKSSPPNRMCPPQHAPINGQWVLPPSTSNNVQPLQQRPRNTRYNIDSSSLSS